MKETKLFNVRLSKELWFFLKQHSWEKGITMNSIIISALEKKKKYLENKLTSDDTNI
jgi:hypothetical protein